MGQMKEVRPMSRIKFRALALAASVSAIGALPAAAHHSFSAEFDVNQPVQLRGEVIRMEFTNPHSYIYLKVTTDTGEVQEWAIEGGAPNALIRRGWNRNSLPAGTEVTVLGYRSRDGGLRASGGAVTLPDGTELDANSVGVGAAPTPK
jgi:hypothetical protein